MKYSPRPPAAFTLVELMVSVAIIGLIMLVMVQMTDQTSRTWRNTTEKIEKFQEARDGFEAMTRRLSQATLNTYWDYLDQTGTARNPNVNSSAFKNFIPYMYGRMSNLRFVSGPMSAQAAATGAKALGAGEVPVRNRPGHGVFFQAPFGVVTTADAQSSATNYGLMNNLLNTWGYFVETDYDTTVPTFVTNTGTVRQRWRPRLMEFSLPSEQMALYDPTDTTYKWFTVFTPKVAVGTVPPRPVRVLAENILTLVLLPKLSDADQQALKQTYGSSSPNLCPNYEDHSYPVDASGTPLQPPVNPGVASGIDANLQASINPKNQLPPIVSVTMVAIDERSAERLADSHNLPGSASTPSMSDAMMGLDFSGLFKNSLSLEGANTGDLYALEQMLVNEKITYRVFTTNVTIRGAKWSRSQTK